MWREIEKAEYINGYKIMVWFDDGTKKIIDLSDVIIKYPVFKPLADIDLFRQFKVTDTLEWNNGKIDIAPEYLYDHGTLA